MTSCSDGDMVLWNVVGQAVRYGVKGAAALAQTETAQKMGRAIDPPAVVELKLDLLDRKAQILGGVLAGLDSEADRTAMLDGAGARIRSAEKKIKRWANGSTFVLDSEVAEAVLGVMPFIVDVVGSSSFTSPDLTRRAAEVLRGGPHVLALMSRFDADPTSGMRFIEAIQRGNSEEAGRLVRRLGSLVFPLAPA